MKYSCITAVRMEYSTPFICWLCNVSLKRFCASSDPKKCLIQVNSVECSHNFPPPVNRDKFSPHDSTDRCLNVMDNNRATIAVALMENNHNQLDMIAICLCAGTDLSHIRDQTV